VGSDHAGFELKAVVIALLHELGHETIDVGTDSRESVDYPDFIRPAAESVARSEADRAIVIGGSGNGEAIAANKVRGIRCALCHDVTTARLSREHNDANALSLGARIVGSEVARDIVIAWLATPYSNEERHTRRIRKIAEME
jgi:ribose 5-phosphate isomerase B